MSRRPELAHLCVDAYPTRAAWLAARNAVDTVGASEASIVLGVSPHGTPWSFWESKRSPKKEKHGEALQRGHRWEPSVLAEYEDESKHQVLTPTAAVHAPSDQLIVLSNPRLPWLRQSPDAFALDGKQLGQVEAKTAVRAQVWAPEHGVVIEHWDDAHADLVPPHYAVQGYTQLIVTDLPWVDLCALVPRGMWLGVRWVRLMRDESTQTQIEEALTEWRARHLIAGEPPDLDGSDACNRYLAAKFPSPSGKNKPSRVATQDEQRDLIELADIKARVKVDEARSKILRNKLIASARGSRLSVGGHPKAPYGQPQFNSGKVTYDYDALRRVVPRETLAACERQGDPYETFNLYRFDNVPAAKPALQGDADDSGSKNTVG
jgi:predicted phage-related endonuclease